MNRIGHLLQNYEISLFQSKESCWQVEKNEVCRLFYAWLPVDFLTELIVLNVKMRPFRC